MCLNDGLGNYIYSLAPVNFCSLLNLDSKYTHYTLRAIKGTKSLSELRLWDAVPHNDFLCSLVLNDMIIVQDFKINIKVRSNGRILLANNYLLHIKHLCNVLGFKRLIYRHSILCLISPGTGGILLHEHIQ